MIFFPILTAFFHILKRNIIAYYSLCCIYSLADAEAASYIAGTGAILLSICGSATASCRDSTCYTYRKCRRQRGLSAVGYSGAFQSSLRFLPSCWKCCLWDAANMAGQPEGGERMGILVYAPVRP